MHFSYVHSILSHGMIFWGNSYYSKNIFKIQKTLIRATMSPGKRDSCHKFFRQLNILLLQSQYIFSLLLFIIKNTDQSLSNTEVRDIHTRHKSNFHLPKQIQHYIRKKFFMQEGEFITTYCQLWRTDQMMGIILKQLSSDISWIIPSMAWRNILIKKSWSWFFSHSN